jgi:Mrp family chromosome partitioning ATPase
MSDVILIDSPAFGDAAEAQMVAEVADATLLVVRPGRTKAVGLGRLKATMDVLDTPVIGIVANHARETATAASVYV